jgi:hypothetical protein
MDAVDEGERRGLTDGGACGLPVDFSRRPDARTGSSVRRDYRGRCRSSNFGRFLHQLSKRVIQRVITRSAVSSAPASQSPGQLAHELVVAVVGERARRPVHRVWGNGESGQEHLVVLRDAVDVHAVLADVGLVAADLLDPLRRAARIVYPIPSLRSSSQLNRSTSRKTVFPRTAVVAWRNSTHR